MFLGLGPMMATSGAWEDKAGRFGYRGDFMMGREGDSMFMLGGVLHLVTWFLVVALLVVLIRYFWKLGDKIK